jgi:hypothetical protein
MIRIYDDIVDVDFQQKISKIIEDSSFPWYFLEDITYKSSNDVKIYLENENAYSGFSHYFYAENKILNSDFHFVKSLLLYIKDFDISSYNFFNCRAFMQLPLIHKDKEYNHNHKHTDMSEKHKSISVIYYVNDSDGDTIFFGKNVNDEISLRVKPKKGRIVLFDSCIYHASTDPFNNNKRIIINFILKKENHDYF